MLSRRRACIFARPPWATRKAGPSLLRRTRRLDIGSPCFDAPNEKFTSEITCLLPEGMVALSNGRLIQSGSDAETKLTSFTWLQDKPHVNYLISLVAGPFVKIEDTYKEIPMAFWTLPSEKDQAIHSFRHTKAMMAFFEETIESPYPWDKYDQVCVNDFVAGHGKHQSDVAYRSHPVHS